MATTDTVPSRFDIGINGTGYMVDTQYLEAYRSRTLDPIRRQADSSDSVGESSLNPEGFWRRSPESWHKGAGQTRYDASDSDPERFLGSSGVDIWTKGQLSLLRAATDQAVTPSLVGSAIGETVESGGRFVTIEPNGSTKLYVYHTGLSTTSAVATTGSDVTAITANDTTVYYVDNNILYSDSIFTLETGTGSPTTLLGGATTIAGVQFVGGRLLCTDTSGDLYDISALPASLPTSIGTLTGSVNQQFLAAYVDGYIYVGVRVGTEIFKTTLKSDGTGLEQITVAATLPDNGWTIQLHGYLNFLIIHTLPGWRLALAGDSGDLTVGGTFADNDASNIAYGMATEGEIVYLSGYLNSDYTSKRGLLAVNLSIINDALEPAYCKGVETNLNGITFVWQANADSPYMLETDGTLWNTTGASSYVTSGYVDMGEVSFGTRENKLFLDPVETVEDGTVSHRLTTPDGTNYTDANVDTAEPAVDWRMTLTPTVSGNDMTVKYPILRALPSPSPIDETTVPLLLHRRVENRQGVWEEQDPQAQLTALRALRIEPLIDFQEGSLTRSAQVIGVDWLASDRDLDGSAWDGTALVRLKVIA